MAEHVATAIGRFVEDNSLDGLEGAVELRGRTQRCAVVGAQVVGIEVAVIALLTPLDPSVSADRIGTRAGLAGVLGHEPAGLVLLDGSAEHHAELLVSEVDVHPGGAVGPGEIPVPVLPFRRDCDLTIPNDGLPHTAARSRLVPVLEPGVGRRPALLPKAWIERDQLAAHLRTRLAAHQQLQPLKRGVVVGWLGLDLPLHVDSEAVLLGRPVVLDEQLLASQAQAKWLTGPVRCGWPRRREPHQRQHRSQPPEQALPRASRDPTRLTHPQYSSSGLRECSHICDPITRTTCPVRVCHRCPLKRYDVHLRDELSDNRPGRRASSAAKQRRILCGRSSRLLSPLRSA